jgi:hypothetical protein
MRMRRGRWPGCKQNVEWPAISVFAVVSLSSDRYYGLIVGRIRWIRVCRSPFVEQVKLLVDPELIVHHADGGWIKGLRRVRVIHQSDWIGPMHEISRGTHLDHLLIGLIDKQKLVQIRTINCLGPRDSIGALGDDGSETAAQSRLSKTSGCSIVFLEEWGSVQSKSLQQIGFLDPGDGKTAM